MPVPLQRQHSHRRNSISVKDRIHLYSDHVKEKGGTPPAPEPTMFKRERRATMPILEVTTLQLKKVEKEERRRGRSLPPHTRAKSLGGVNCDENSKTGPTSATLPRLNSHSNIPISREFGQEHSVRNLREWRKQYSTRERSKSTTSAKSSSEDRNDRNASVSEIIITFEDDDIPGDWIEDVGVKEILDSFDETGRGDSRVYRPLENKTNGSHTVEDMLRRERNHLLAENMYLKQYAMSLEQNASEEISESRPRIKRRKKSKAHFQELMIEVDQMERVSTYTQVFKKFLLSEGRYLNKLLVLSEYFVVPFKLLVAYKPNVLSFNDYQSLFLNCEELVRFHKMFHTSLVAVSVDDEQALVGRFLSALETNMPYITVYGPFLASKQPMRRKLFSELMKNREFAEIVGYQEQATETSLKELLDLPYTRLQGYIDVLQLMENLPFKVEKAQKGFAEIVHFLTTQSESLRNEPGEWAEMKKKLINFLERLTPDSIIPVEVFDPTTVLKKCGQLETIINGKVTSKECFLFSRHFALATIEHQSYNLEYKLDSPGLISLCGARVYSKVDVKGQAIQEDFDTGLEVDHEAFLVELPHRRGSYLLKAHKPLNWVQQFRESIKEAEKCTCNTHSTARDSCFTANFGGSLAAASMEKLIALLINPQSTIQKYTDIVLTTYPSFTSAKSLLEALIASAIQYNQDEEKKESVVHPVYPHHLPAKQYSELQFGNQWESEDDNMIHPEMLPTSPVNRGFVSDQHKRNKIWFNSMNSAISDMSPRDRRSSDETLTPLDTPRTSEVCIQPVQLEPVVEEVFPSTTTLAEGDISGQGENVTPKPRQLRRKRSLSVPDIFERLKDVEEVKSGEETLMESEEESQANLSESPTGSNSELEYCESVSESQSTSVVASPSPTYPCSLSNSPPNGKDFKPAFTMPRKDGVISPSFLNIPQNSAMHNSTSNPEGLNSTSDSKCKVLNYKSGSHDLSKGKKARELLEQTSMTPQLGRKKRRSKIVKVWKLIKQRSHPSKRASESDPIKRTGSISSSIPFTEDDGFEIVEAMIRVLQVIEYWIKNYPEDFSANPLLRTNVQQFITDLEVDHHYFSSHDLFVAALQLSGVLNSCEEKLDDSLPMVLSKTTGQEVTYLKLLFGSELGIINSPSSLDLLSFKPVDVAQQLTLFQFAIFSAIKRCELLNTSWKSKKKEKLAPNVLRAISEGNRIVSWVITEVLGREAEGDRVDMIEFFIQVAHECFRHNDLHSLTMIHSSLSSYTIQRLKGTWSHVDRKHKERLQMLKPYCDLTGRSKKMREHIKSKKPPCLPYLGAYLDQIWSLEQSKATKSSQDLINFSKLKSLHEIITSILKYQKTSYKFHPQFKIIRYIHTASCLSDEEHYDLSKKYEPN